MTRKEKKKLGKLRTGLNGTLLMMMMMASAVFFSLSFFCFFVHDDVHGLSPGIRIRAGRPPMCEAVQHAQPAMLPLLGVRSTQYVPGGPGKLNRVSTVVVCSSIRARIANLARL